MRHRQRRQKRSATPDRHVCCRHAGRPLLNARRWLWLTSAVAAAVIVGFTYTDIVAPAVSMYVRCNTPGVTCYGYRDLPAPPPAVPSSLGGSL